MELAGSRRRGMQHTGGDPKETNSYTGWRNVTDLHTSKTEPRKDVYIDSGHPTSHWQPCITQQQNTGVITLALSQL